MSKRNLTEKLAANRFTAAQQLVTGDTSALEAWLKEYGSSRQELKGMVRGLCMLAQTYYHNEQTLGERTAQQSAEWEFERERLLDGMRGLEDAHNHLIHEHNQQSNQVDALLQVIGCQNDAVLAYQRLFTAVIAAAAAGIILTASDGQ